MCCFIIQGCSAEMHNFTFVSCLVSLICLNTVTNKIYCLPNIIIIIIIMIVMHRPQKEYDVHVLIGYIYNFSAYIN